MGRVQPIRQRKLLEEAPRPRLEREPGVRKAPVSDFILAALKDAGRRFDVNHEFEGYILREFKTIRTASVCASEIRRGHIRVRGGVQLTHNFETIACLRNGSPHVWIKVLSRREQ